MNAPRTQIIVTPGGDAGSAKLACASCPAHIEIADVSQFHRATLGKFVLVPGLGWICSACYMRTAPARS